MAHGDPLLSPWLCEFSDYLQRVVRITVNFNDTTRALQGAIVHRDTGCLWHTIVIGDPNDPGNVLQFPCPNDGQGDQAVSKAQLAAKGLNTIEDAMALQITAKP